MTLTALIVRRGILFLSALAFAVPLMAGPAAAVDVKRVVSPGGIEAWLIEDHTVPVTAIEFTFRGGAAMDPEGKEGLANMTASLMDEGAGDLDSQAFQRRLEELAVQFGFNAGQDTFQGSFKTLNRNRDEALALMRLALTQPRFDQDTVDRLRQQIMTGLRARSRDPNYIASRVFSRMSFPDHPYGTDSDGTLKGLEAVTVADLKGFVSRHLARDRLIIGVTGDVTAAELGPMLDRVFGDLPASTDAPKVVAEVEPALSGQTAVVKQDIPQSVAVFGQPGIARQDPDWYAALLVDHILGGGGFTSRLYKEVREIRGLAYSVYTSLHPLDASALMVGGVATQNARMQESLELIRKEWAQVQKEGVTEEELADAKAYITGSFALRFSSTDRIARILVSLQYHDLGLDYLDRRDELIDGVSLEQANRVAARLLDPARLSAVVVGSPQNLEPTVSIPDTDS